MSVDALIATAREMDPGRGDPWPTELFASNVRMRAEEYEEWATALRQAENEVDERACRGSFGDGWRADVAGQAPVAQTLADECRQVAAAADAYATAHRDIRVSAIDLQDSLEQEVAGLEGIRSQPQYNGGRHMADESGMNTMLIRRADQIEWQIREISQALHRLQEQRDEADQEFARAVEGLPSVAAAGFSEVQGLLAAQGISSVAELRDLDAAEAAALVHAAMEAAAENGRQGDVDALGVLLDVYGHDDLVMSTALATLGGAGVVRLLTEIGQGRASRDSALQVATQVRSALAGVSTAWSRERAEAFAADMFDGLGATSAWNPAASVVGFLFADHDADRIGQELTVAVADQLDRYERRSTWFSQGGTWTNGVGRGLWAFAGGENPGARVHDPAGRVLETLGRYPDAALDWLTDSGADDVGGTGQRLGKARAQYWFGERDWSADRTGDGFEGPGALWAGAQQAPGSLLAPTGAEADTAVQRQVANLSTDLFEHLAGNESFLAENLTPAGSVQLGHAIAQQIPQLAVNGVMGDPNGEPDERAVIAGVDGKVHVVNAWPKDIAKVVGPAMTHLGGAVVVKQAAVQHTDDVLEGISADHYTEREALDAVNGALQLDGAVEGGRMGALLGTAHRDDEAIRQLVTTASSGVSAISLPGGYPAAVGLGVATGEVAAVVGDELAGAYDEVRAAETDRAEMLDRLTAGRAMTAAQVLDAEFPGMVGDRDTFVDNRLGDYASKYEHWLNDARGIL